MWNIGPTVIPVGQGNAPILMPFPTTGIHSVDPPIKAQILNNSSQFLSAIAGGYDYLVPPQSALTIPVSEGEAQIEIDPRAQSTVGFPTLGYVSIILLSSHETSPYPDGPLATPIAFPTSIELFRDVVLTGPNQGHSDGVLPYLPPIYHTVAVTIENSTTNTAQVGVTVGLAPNATYYNRVWSLGPNLTGTYMVPFAAIPTPAGTPGSPPPLTYPVFLVFTGELQPAGSAVTVWAYADQHAYTPSVPPPYS